MKTFSWVLAFVLFVAQSPAGYPVETERDKKADFTRYRTYTWGPGYAAFDPGGHKVLVGAIEGELSALGLTKQDTGTADLTVAYYSLHYLQVNIKEFDRLYREKRPTASATYNMGKLVIVVTDTSTTRQLWAAKTREYLSSDAAAREQAIQQVVAKLFATYPTRRQR